MVYISDLQKLIGTWMERINNPVHSLSYKDAISDCIYELNEIVNKAVIDQLDYESMLDYIHNNEADIYLSSAEAHERVS